MKRYKVKKQVSVKEMKIFKPGLTFLIYFFSFYFFGQTTNPKIGFVLDSLREAYEIPALSVSLIQPDTCYYGIKGVTNINGDVPVSLTSKFHLGSNSKAITSFLAMKMVEKKEISLETKFIDIFPNLTDSIAKDYLPITLSDLMSHQALVQPYTSGIEFMKLPVLKGTTTEKRYQFSKYVLNEQTSKKGTYSNAGYVLVALMLEKVSKKSFEYLLDELMNDLEFEYFIGFPNKETVSNPWGHWRENEKLVPLAPSHFYQLKDFMLPAGDISMNSIDYSKFIRLHLNGLLKNDNYLKAKNYRKMHFGFSPYSYGWGNNLTEGKTISFHDGSAGTYYCHTILYPEKKMGVVVMANAADQEQIKGIYKLREWISENMEIME